MSKTLNKQEITYYLNSREHKLFLFYYKHCDINWKILFLMMFNNNNFNHLIFLPGSKLFGLLVLSGLIGRGICTL